MDFDIEFCDGDDFCAENAEFDEPNFEGAADKLIFDAIHRNIAHLEKRDIDECFAGRTPQYFETETLSALVDFAKGGSGKIAAMLIFVGADSVMSEVKAAIDVLLPFCADGKILFGAGGESQGAKYRMLLCREQTAEN